MPISRVRRATLYEMTPYRPMLASSAAISPNSSDKVATRRSLSRVSRIIAGSDWREMIVDGATSAMTARSDPETSAGEATRIRRDSYSREAACAAAT